MFLNDLKYSSRQGPAASEFTSIFSIHLAKILTKEGKKRSIKKRRNYRLYQRNTLLVKTNPGRSLFSLLGRVVYRLWSISWTKLWLVPQNTEVCRAPYFFFFLISFILLPSVTPSFIHFPPVVWYEYFNPFSTERWLWAETSTAGWHNTGDTIYFLWIWNRRALTADKFFTFSFVTSRNRKKRFIFCGVPTYNYCL